MTDDLKRPAANRAAQHLVNKAAPQDRDWCRIVVNKATDDAPSSAEVMLYDEIGFWGTTASDFVNELNGLDVGTINLRINSPGGDVYDGVAILNALRNHDATVNVTVDGLAASAASYIAMGGDTITMGRNSELMIHDAAGMVLGGPDDMAEFAVRLNQISDNIASIYAERAGGTPQEWRAAMKAETWYSAQEAVDAGLADKVQPAKDAPAKTTNRFDLTVFNHAGRSAAPDPFIPTESPSQSPAAASADGKPEDPKEGSAIVAFSDESTATLRQKLGLAEDADEATILAALDESLEERAEPQNTAPELPEGVVTIDEAVLNSLRSDAQAGREARTQQESEHRQTIVDAAVREGRIAPARRDAWLNRLKADPEEAATLNSLEKGLSVPTNELGFGSDSDVESKPINDAEADALASLLPGTRKEAFLNG